MAAACLFRLRLQALGSGAWRIASTESRNCWLSAISLARARELRAEAKSLLAEGIDPGAHAKAEKAAQAAITEHTFDRIAAELVEKLRKEGKADVTLTKKQWLLDMASAGFGDRPITAITAADILVTLRKVEAKGNYESAKRLRSTIGQVFRYAIATARAENDPTYGLRGALIAPKVSHMAAITDWDGFSDLIRAIWNYDGGSPSTWAALKLMALLYSRPGELRLALWEEFDLERAIWTIPEDEANLFPVGESRIADMVGCAPATAKKAVNELIAGDFLRVEQKRRNRGKASGRDRIVSLTQYDTETAVGDPGLPVKTWQRKQKSTHLKFVA